MASKSIAEYPPAYLPGLKLRAVFGEDVDFVKDGRETKILVCLKHFSPRYKLFPEDRSPTLLVTYTRGAGLKEDDEYGNAATIWNKNDMKGFRAGNKALGRLKRRITKVFDIDETGAVDGYRGYYSYLIRLEEDANIDSIELDVALSLWSGKKEKSDEETSRTGQLINVTHKYMPVGESYVVDADDLDEDETPQVIFLHWDFTNIEMRQMISSQQMEAFNRDKDIPLDVLLLGAADDQIYNPLEPLRFHVNLTGLEIKPEELSIQVFATGESSGKSHGEKATNHRREDRELALGPAAISRTPNKTGWVTFEFPAKYVISALLAAYAEEDNYVVDVNAVTNLIRKGQYNLSFDSNGDSDEQRLKTSISNVIRSARLSIAIQAPADCIGKFPTEAGIQSNDMYFDSAVRMLKNRAYWNDQKLLNWSAMACLSTVADKDRLYPLADFKTASVESRAVGSPVDGIQRFELIMDFPDMSFNWNLVSLLVQNCDADMGFLGIDSSRRFMYQEKPDTVRDESNGRRRIKFKWIAIDSKKTPRFILIKASAILHSSPQNGIMKAVDGDKKIGPTITFMVKVGEENNVHTIAMNIQNEPTTQMESKKSEGKKPENVDEVIDIPGSSRSRSIVNNFIASVKKLATNKPATIAIPAIVACILFLSRGSKTAVPVELDEVKEELPICDLYMGQSAIPGMGLGIFTNKPIEIGQTVATPDILLNILDYGRNFKMSQLFTTEEGVKWKETIKNKTDKKDDCAVWAMEGECESYPDFMLSNCEKSCALAAAKMDLTKALGSKNDVTRECSGWAKAGLCTKNPYKMLEECPVSCAVEDHGLDFDMKDLKKWVTHEYLWSAEKTQSSYEATKVDSLSPGIGALANAHPYLNNVDMNIPSIDNIDLHRSKDAGVGAFSDRHNLGFVATKHIPAGMEIFVDREDGWFIDQEEEKGPISLDQHHEQADEIIKNFFENASGSDDAAMRSKYQAIKNSIKKVRVKILMPDTLEGAREALVKGTTKLGTHDAIRSQKWLVENGMCLDGLRVGHSTLPQAGRGAFANRDIKEGQVIAPMPLLQADMNRLRHFVGDLESNGQLLLNYSYGHRNSSLRLIPYSPMVNFVNHHNRDKSRVNARLQWSTKAPHDKSWEEDTVEEILNREYVGLMLELIATSDIQKGEEVFLDYGSQWDDAWDSYLQSWRDHTQGDKFVSIHQYNSEKVITTVEEQASTPYASNVMTTCWVGALDNASKKKRGLDWRHHRVDMDASISGRPLKPLKCTILSRYKESSNSDDFLYEVDISPGTGGAELLLNNVPRRAIEFVYKPYMSDQHINGSFRQSIQIPDDIFPESWMDLKSK